MNIVMRSLGWMYSDSQNIDLLHRIVSILYLLNLGICRSLAIVKSKISDGSGLEKSGPGGSGPGTFGLGRARA